MSATPECVMSQTTTPLAPPIDIRGHLLPLSGLLAHKVVGRPGPLGLIGRVVRKLVKAFIRPWLDFQTRYNHAVIEQFVDLHDTQRQQVAAVSAAVAAQLARAAHETNALRTRLIAAGERLTAAEARANTLQARCDQLARTCDELINRDVEQAAVLRREIAAAVEQMGWRVGEAIVHADRRVDEASRAAEERERAAAVRAEVEKVEAINLELGYKGQIAAAGLWFNPPVGVQLKDVPRVTNVTERIVEHIFVHNRIPRPPAKVLDMGCAESTTAIELASLGFQVTGVDLRRLPLEHPNFRMMEANLGDLPFADAQFDIVVCLSTIEHVGLGWYTDGDPTTDKTALVEAVRVLRPGGTFLLTVPFGRRAVTPVHRVYDLEQLNELVAPLTVTEMSFAVRDGEAWTFTADAAVAGQADSAERVGAVALVVAEKPTAPLPIAAAGETPAGQE
jgi:ubiquinone/menaquinone biosynthesis C-methylase UbiE